MSATNGISGDANLNPSATRARPSTAKRSQKSRKSAPINFLHTAARTYHDLGLPITLCRGKAPWQDEWPTLSWAPHTIDAAFRFHGAANVGLVLGRRSGLVDFDCDGPEAEQTLLDLFNGNIPETPTWRSRRGLHRLFRWHPALEQLNTNKKAIGGDGAKVEVLIGPAWQTLLPPSYADGVKREWVYGDNLLPDGAAVIPNAVLRSLGCQLPTETGASQSQQQEQQPAASGSQCTDRLPTSVVSVVSVISVHSSDDPVVQRIMAVIRKHLVVTLGTRNDTMLRLARDLKGLPESSGMMAEDLEPYIKWWYEQSLDFMQEKDWRKIWEHWLYLWLWAKPGYDFVRLAFEASKQVPQPECALQYPVQSMRQLIGLCRILQHRHADERGVWFICCRDAGAMIGVQHTLAARLLKRLVGDEILEIVEPGTKTKATRYRYLGD